jgi:hypothetical protein
MQRKYVPFLRIDGGQVLAQNLQIPTVEKRLGLKYNECHEPLTYPLCPDEIAVILSGASLK